MLYADVVIFSNSINAPATSRTSKAMPINNASGATLIIKAVFQYVSTRLHAKEKMFKASKNSLPVATQALPNVLMDS